MTVWDLLKACRRHLLVLAAGLVLTAGMSFWVGQQRGVYWAQTDLIFLAPTSSRFPNSLSSGSESLIGTASIVKNRVGLGDDLEATSSASISLVDDGVRDGTLVRLPNVGGQWAASFSQPVLDIQAVAGSADVVDQRMQAMEAAIVETLRQLQDEADVDASDRIQIQASPSAVEVQFVQGSRIRAVVVACLLGVSTSLAMVALLERRRVAKIGWPAFDEDFTEIRWASPMRSLGRLTGKRSVRTGVPLVEEHHA